MRREGDPRSRENRHASSCCRCCARISLRGWGGLFSGYDGLYEGSTARKRELVLLDLLGRKVQVEVPAMALEAVL